MPTTPNRRTARALRRGFTLVEIIVVIVIIGVLATLIAPRILGRVGQSKTAVAQSNASAVANAVRMYMADFGAPPSDLSVLAQRPQSGQKGQFPYVDNADQLKDPWGRAFVIKVPGEKNFDFDIISLGADNKPGGTGEDEDVTKP